MFTAKEKKFVFNFSSPFTNTLVMDIEIIPGCLPCKKQICTFQKPF